MSALLALKQRLTAREDSEHEQALLRILIVGLVLGYMAVFHGWRNDWTAADTEIVLVLSGFWAIAIALFVAICARPAVNVGRRLAGMVSDAAGCTWYMSVAGEYGFFVIGIFLFVAFGNGFRFGRRYLFISQLLCLTGLIAVLLFVPFWEERRVEGVGLLIALAVLPLYVATLLKRIQEARARAEEANLAKTTFLANMSHEIRTPLNGIVGVIDLFRTTDLSTQQSELVQLLRHSAAVLRSLVDDVLDISKIESGRLTVEVSSFDLYATINGLIALLRPHAQSKSLSLHATVDPEIDYRVRGDSHHLRQILLNLLGNAIKFTERGEVSLSVTLKKTTIEGITTRFEVRDSGIGIERDLLPKIFERFVQADQSTTRRFGGSGLGTTIAKELVELMGGSIGVDSQIGEGTTFWFELPLLRDAEVKETPSVPQPLPASRERTILVADHIGTQLALPVLVAAGEHAEVFSPTDSIGVRLATMVESGSQVRAVIAACAIDSACAAFTSAVQAAGNSALALIYVAREPLSVVDSARIKSIRQAQVLVSPVLPRIMANAIHAALANSGRDSDVVDLPQLVSRERIHLRILVADDNHTNQAIVSQLLSTAGHTVVVASDGEEALDIYEQDHPDVALLDFNMPHRNGLEVVRAIRMTEPVGRRMPTIILSASVTTEARERAIDAGADDFVGKPFDAVLLLEKIDNFAKHIRSHDRKTGTVQKSVGEVLPFLPVKKIATGGGTDSGILDYARLAELEDISRDATFLTTLLRGFKGDVEALMGRLEGVGTDSAETNDILHALKGAAVGIGAPQLAKLCDRIESADWPKGSGTEGQVESLRSCVRETFAELNDYVRNQHQSSL